jgi:hypothetical protein
MKLLERKARLPGLLPAAEASPDILHLACVFSSFFSCHFGSGGLRQLRLTSVIEMATPEWTGAKQANRVPT